MITQDQLHKLQTVLITACDQHIEQGGKIINRYYSIDGKKCCPIYCLIGCLGGGAANKLSEIIGFEITDEQVYDFFTGFDQYNRSINDQSFYTLGIQLHSRYIQTQNGNNK